MHHNGSYSQAVSRNSYEEWRGDPNCGNPKDNACPHPSIREGGSRVRWADEGRSSRTEDFRNVGHRDRAPRSTA
jgi:hypothetical protein